MSSNGGAVTLAAWRDRARTALGPHARHAILGALVAGLLAGGAGRRLALALAVSAASAGAGLGRPRLGLLAGAALLAGALGAHARLAAQDRTELGPWLGRHVAMRAVALEAPRERRFGTWTVPARIVAAPGAGERIVLHGRGAPRGEIGAELAVSGTLRPLAGWESFEGRRGAHAALEADRISVTGRRRGGLEGAIDRIRRAAEHGVSTGLPPPQAALARGMVLGQDEALDEDTRAAFRTSGLAHVLAASGQNVVLLATLAIAAVALAGGGLRLRIAVALALVGLYVPLAGGGPSIRRAGVMGGAALVAALAGRPASRGYALLLAAAVTLGLEPRSAAEPGWLLSFAAVAAIALLAPRVRAALVDRGLPRPVAEAAAMTFAATLGTAPLLALYFGRLSLASLPANLAATPAVAPVVWLGTLSGALAQLGPVADPALHAINAVTALPLGFVGAVAARTAGLPHADVPLALGVPAVLGVYGALAAIALSPGLRGRAARAVGLSGRGRSSGRAGPALALAAALACVAILVTGRTPAPPRLPTVSFLDVGQGDATLLQDGGATVLVDTGPPDGPILERLRAAGVRRIDLLVLSHGETDHAGAAARVLRALPVSAVLDGTTTAPARATPGAQAAIAAARVRRVRPVAGRQLAVGRLRLRVLWPPAGPAGPAGPVAPAVAGANPNDRAIVLLAGDGPLDVLLTADAESPVTGALDLPAVDVLKVAHHGSADPGLPALLERLRPRFAAIEVGRGNPYGHPTAGTLAELRDAGAQVLRTDRDGTVRVTLDGARISVATER